MDHSFGGPWTEEKLTRLRKYLEAYTKIFTTNERARYFRRWYVDAFAGTGLRNQRPDDDGPETLPLFESDPDVDGFTKGSARIALEIEPPFHRYLFIDKDPEFAAALRELTAQFPEVSNQVEIENADANTVLVDWAHRVDWHRNRAVVFLDPYGMQVEWATIEILAETKAVDLWILFPLGQGLNRLLTTDGPHPGAGHGA